MCTTAAISASARHAFWSTPRGHAPGGVVENPAFDIDLYTELD